MRTVFPLALLVLLVFPIVKDKISHASETGYLLLWTNSGSPLIDNYYLAVGGGMCISEPEAQTLLTRTGTLASLCIRLTAAPGDSATRTFVLRKNGMNTPLAVTFKGAKQLVALDTVDKIPVTRWDLVDIMATSSGTAASASCAASFELVY